MAVLDQVTTAAPGGIDFKAVYRAAIWSWYRVHKDDVIYTHKFFAFLSISITVEKCRPLLVAIAGEEDQ